MSHSPTFLSSSLLRRLGMVAAVCAAALAVSVAVTACGGGSEAKKFVPTQILSFGDENSYLNASGQKYTINSVALDSNGNALDSSGAITTSTSNMVYLCQNYALWVQTVAANYGFDGAQCPVSGASTNAYFLANDPTTISTDASGNINSTNAATAVTNAGVAQVIQTITNHVGSMNNTTMVLVLAGQPDVLEAYAQYINGGNLNSLESDLSTLGSSLADGLVQVVNTGARVVLLRIPDLSLSPLGVSAANTTSGSGGMTDQAALSALTAAFNNGLTNEAGRKFNGNQMALVRADDLTQTMVNNYSSYSLNNETTPACTTALTSLTAPLCNSSYVSGNTSGMSSSTGGSTFLWADYTHLSPVGHSYLASLVLSRISAQPF